MDINHNAQFTTVPGCTLCSYASDVVSGPGQMQFTNDWLTNPALISDPWLNDTSYWVMKNCELVESLDVVRLDVVANGQSYLYHRIPAESIEQYQGLQTVLSADCVSDSFPPGTVLGLNFLYVPNDSQFGHDTIVMPEPRLMIEPGTIARLGLTTTRCSLRSIQRRLRITGCWPLMSASFAVRGRSRAASSGSAA